jgi:membrane protease YdiL (CAAX protease family)
MTLEYQPLPPKLRRFSIGEIAAWLVILLAVGTIIFAPRWATKPTATAKPTEPGPTFSLLITGRYLVGLNAVQPIQSIGVGSEALDALEKAAETPADELRTIIVRIHIEGKRALASLPALTSKHPELRLDAEFLEQIYSGKVDTTALIWPTFRARHGWFADLAMSHDKPPADPLRRTTMNAALRTMAAGVTLSMLALGAGLAGVPLLILGLVLYFRKRLVPAFNHNPPLPADRGVYVEAFAFYLGITAFAGLAVRFVLPHLPDIARIVAIAAMPLGFLLAILWPRLRGQSWQDVRTAFGLHAPRGFFREAIAGIIGYIAGFPVAILGILITLLLVTISGQKASHPIAESVTGGPLVLLLIFFLASIFAPITEELMFRGALYAHMRQRFGFILSGLSTGILFAAIHPQGWAAIPALTALAFVFAGIREWRGSIWPGVIAHAMNNTVVMAMLVVMVS